MFTGEYRHSVDAKGRVAIPVRFRLPLGEGAMLARWVDGCAAIFPGPRSRSWREKVRACRSPTSGPVPSRVSCSRAPSTSKRDQQGRILSCRPPSREWSGVGTDAVVVGARDHVEIWESGTGGRASSSAVDSADALASQLTGLGIS